MGSIKNCWIAIWLNKRSEYKYLTTITVIAIIVVLFITLFYKELFILSFDEEYSKVIGIPKWIQFFIYCYCSDGYFCLNACCRDTVSKCVNHVTNCNKYANNKSFKQLILLSVFLGELSVILGLVPLSIWTFSGWVIVVLLVILLMITMAYQKNANEV